MEVKIDIRKFQDYIFKPDATHGKQVIFKLQGYDHEHAEVLVALYREQARKQYKSGKYHLGKADQHGQRIDIEIQLHGINESHQQTCYIRSGWMIEQDGSIRLLTPFSGFTRDKEV